MNPKLFMPLILLTSCSPPAMAAGMVDMTKQTMTPLVLTSSLKQKGNRYKFSFAKGKAVSPLRYKIIPLKVIHHGKVTLASNKTKLSYATYRNEACTQKCDIDTPGTYYVKVSQSAYSIDLTDHNYAQFKKASIILYVSQIRNDDISLKEKTYAIVSGRPRIKICTKKGYITVRSQYLDGDGKYQYGGRYDLYDGNMKKMNQHVIGNGRLVILKGNFYLVPDGKANYRLKYTWHQAPYKKNTNRKKARLLSKTSQGVFYQGGKEHRFYKMKIEDNQIVNFQLSGMRADQVRLLSYDAEGNETSYQLNPKKVADDTYRYTSERLKKNTYYIELSKKVNDACGYFYTLTI